jgi:hypothetical protein
VPPNSPVDDTSDVEMFRRQDRPRKPAELLRGRTAPTTDSPSEASSLRESLPSPTYRILQKTLSQDGLVPPELSVTNVVSKDIAMPSSGSPITATSAPQPMILASTSPLRFVPRSDEGGLKRNHSSSSLLGPVHSDETNPMTTSRAKLTRTQQKLLLQKASLPLAHALPLTATYPRSSPEPNADKGTVTPSAPGSITSRASISLPYDIKAAKEYDRVSRQLANVKKFGSPTSDALRRLRDISFFNRFYKPNNTNTNSNRLRKSQSAFGLTMSWKSPASKSDLGSFENDSTEVGYKSVPEEERSEKLHEIMRKLWNEEIQLSDVQASW